jgi:putative membrane protein
MVASRTQGPALISSVILGNVTAVVLLIVLYRSRLNAVTNEVLTVGYGGFLLLIGLQLLLMVPLALAGRSVCPSASFSAMLRTRLVRDAATSCLPFTGVGGLAFGMRTLIASSGIGWQLAAVAIAADVTMELIAQIVFILIGLSLLLTHGAQANSAFALIGVTAIAGGAAFAALLLQRRIPVILRRLTSLTGNRRLQPTGAASDSLEDAIERVHGQPRRLAAAACFHSLGWIGSAVLTWATYRLLGVPLAFSSALVIEASVSAARLAAFMVPGALGVQEAVYVGLGSAFGIMSTTSLSLSLLRRARELAIGVPVLLAWQLAEVRLVRRRRSITGSPAQ